MVDFYSPYKKYKKTGLPWIPSIPTHWDVWRNGRLFYQRVETGYPDLPILEVSLRTGVTVRDMDNLKRKQKMNDTEKYKRAKQGDIAYNMMRMWQGAVGTAPVDGLISPAYVVASPLQKICTDYYSYLFRTELYKREVNKYSRGIVSDRNRLYWDQFKQMPSLVPPEKEQEKIALFLKVQDARIAQIINAKKSILKKLEVQKVALIHDALGGISYLDLQENIKTKKQSLSIPEGWDFRRIRHCISSLKNGVWGVDPSAENIPEHITCVRVADFDTTSFGISKINLTTRAVDLDIQRSRLLKEGDLLIEKSGGGELTPVGRVVCNTLERKSVCSNFVAAITCNKIIRPKYLMFILYYLHASRFVVSSIKQTTGIQNLDIKNYFSNYIVFPSDVSEQNRVIEELENSLEPVKELEALILKEVNNISEYRDRLVIEVVTGQYDLSKWAPTSEDSELTQGYGKFAIEETGVGGESEND